MAEITLIGRNMVNGNGGCIVEIWGNNGELKAVPQVYYGVGGGSKETLRINNVGNGFYFKVRDRGNNREEVNGEINILVSYIPKDNSLSAKESAEKAFEQSKLSKESSLRVENKLNTVENKLNTLENKINNINTLLPPKIKSINGMYNQTSTLTSSIQIIIIEAEDTDKYRAKANDKPNDKNWDTNNIINVSGLTKGINIIHVQTTNNSNKVTEGSLVVFRI